MLDAHTSSWMDTVVLALAGATFKEFDQKLSGAVERGVRVGASGSDIAFSARISGYYEDYRNVAGTVWPAMIRAYQGRDAEGAEVPYSAVARDLKRKFDVYMAGATKRLRSSVASLGQLGHAMPHKSVEEVCEETRQKFHAEIELLCGELEAERLARVSRSGVLPPEPPESSPGRISGR